jgi:signal transduction histidine kinase
MSMDGEQQAILAELTQSVLADSDLPTVMQQAATSVVHTLILEHSAIWELRSDGSALELRAGVGWQQDTLEEATLTVGTRSPISRTALSMTSVISVDWRSTTQFDQPPLLRDHGVISSIYVVIQGQDRPFGVLSVDVTVPRIFGNQEIYLLQAVANVLALGIERVRAKQTLERQVEELTVENARLVAAAHDKAVLEERERLARDLHDSVTQALYGVTLHAQAARRLLAAGEVAIAVASLQALQDTAQEALDEMRLLIFELRPPILEQVGLVAALQARLNAVEGRANLQTKFIADGIGHLPSHVEQALYRIAQEALNNALKHAHAQRMTVQLRQVQTSVILEMIDDGVGFAPETIRKTGGLGLRGIAERVAQLGGQLTIQSAPGVGTHLRVEIEL